MDKSTWESIDFHSFLSGDKKFQLPEGDALNHLKQCSEQTLKTSLQDCVVGSMVDITDQELSPVLLETLTLRHDARHECNQASLLERPSP